MKAERLMEIRDYREALKKVPDISSQELCYGEYLDDLFGHIAELEKELASGISINQDLLSEAEMDRTYQVDQDEFITKLLARIEKLRTGITFYAFTESQSLSVHRRVAVQDAGKKATTVLADDDKAAKEDSK